MSRMPVVFVSHGSPELAVRKTPAHEFLRGFAALVARPKAILVATAHWETVAPCLSGATAPETIYDFGPFDPRLFEMHYRAPGAPQLAERVAGLLQAEGLPATIDARRGYDHGTWVPLSLMYPSADIPVAQLSIQPHLSPAHHFQLGRALRPLSDEGVLIVASGALTHNLRAFFGQPVSAPAPDWVRSFNDWLADRILAGDDEALVEYRKAAPNAVKNHPTDEHLLPLFVALGARGDGEPVARAHESYEHGVIAMDTYVFGSMSDARVAA